MKFKKLFCIFLIFSASFCADRQLSPEQYQALAIKDTPVIISYFNKLVEKNILHIDHLKKLEKAQELINPITAEERVSSAVLSWATQLDGWLKLPVNMQQINAWATAKIAEIQHEEDTRKQVHEKTRELHRPMRFVPIPAGKYIDDITHEEFEISEGVEIQETPVTQWQWSQIMGSNPSEHVNGSDAEEIIINTEKIKMRPDAPVENVSWDDIQRFLKKCKEPNGEYTYELPSLREYQALLHSFKQHDYFAEYQHKRLWNLTGKYRQFTRDLVELHDTKAHLVFGGKQHVTNIKDIILPIVYPRSREQSVGFRLIRYNTSKSDDPQVNHYSKTQLSWNQIDSPTDAAWRWDEFTQTLLLSGYDSLRWMFEHKNEYPRKIQDTLDALIDNIPYITDDPASPLTNYTSLLLENRLLKDITPLQHLTQLSSLNISINEIQDISVLKYLTRLTNLKVDHNRIQNINALQNLTNLITLNLGNNEIQDISPLQRLTKLTDLDIENNHIKDISPLQHLVNLTDLIMNNNSIYDINPLKNLINLRWLMLSNNQIQSMSSLQYLSRLTHLSLSKNQIKDISLLQTLTQLTHLYLYDNQIQNVGPLQYLINLKQLGLSDNQLMDIEPLQYLNKLEHLLLGHNQIQNISPLQPLSQLRWLWLQKNPFQDMSPLKSLKNLERLCLDKDQIERLQVQKISTKKIIEEWQ